MSFVSSMTGVLGGWAWSLMMGALAVIILAVFGYAGLYVRNMKKFCFPVLEVISFGNGKVAINQSKAGWFQNKRIFFNLIEQGGERELLMKDNRRIAFASSEDFHDVFGVKGLIVKRKDDDPNVVVPISSVDIKNLHLLMEIAPADYRDVASTLLSEKKKEAYTWWDENKATLMQIGSYVLMFVMLIIFFKFVQTESEGWRTTAERIFSSGITPSNTAP